MSITGSSPAKPGVVDSTGEVAATVGRRLPGEHVLASLTTELAVIDADGFIVFTNRAWDSHARDNHGRPEQCGAGVNYFDVCRNASGADAPVARQVLEGLCAVRDGALERFELEYPCHSPQRQLWYLLQASPLHAHDYSIVVAHTDITPRVVAELASRAARSKLEAALSSMTDAVFITDANGDFIDFNAAFVAFHRFASASECAHHLADYPAIVEVRFADGNLVPLEQWAVPRALRGETATSIEYRLRRRDSGAGWVGSYSFAPIRDVAGAVVGSIVIARDITEQVRAADALRDREARLSALLEAASDAIITCEEDGSITSANRATEHLFGYSSALLLGAVIDMLLPPASGCATGEDRVHGVRAGVNDVVSRGPEWLGRRRDGTTFPVDVAVSPMAVGGYTAVIRDVTERKEARTRLLEIAAEEQRRLGQELHDGIQQELAGLALFAGALREFVRNPSQVGEQAQRAWLQHTAERLHEGLQDVHLHVQALSHGIMPVQIDAEGLQAALAALAEQCNASGSVACRFELHGTIMIGNAATATHLYRIAQEALNNALRHADAGEVIISLSQSEDRLVLQVRDNGRGIALTAPQLSSRPGAGLQSMSDRARVIGGVLSIAPAPSHGTAVRCELPLASV